MNPKSPFLSKTLWTNFIMATVAFFPVAQVYVSSHPTAVITGFALVNFLLRLATKQSIGLSDS